MGPTPSVTSASRSRPRRRPHRRPRPPTTPHDALFKGIFSHPDEARGLLRTVLPPAILSQLDLRTLTLHTGSFIDRALAARHTDLLFSACLAGRRVFLYVLFEHQSSTDPLMGFRLLAYMVRIWEHYLATHPAARRLPAILPVVLHHSPTGWSAPVTFEDLLELDLPTLAAIRNYVPHFRFVLEDWSHEDDEALKVRAMGALGRLGALFLKHGRDPEGIVDRLPGWLELVEEVRKAPNGAASLARIWHYLCAISGRSRDRVLSKVLAVVDARTREETMNIKTLAKRIWTREAKREGMLMGQRSALTDLLTARFGPLPPNTTARVQKARAASLRRWIQRGGTVSTLDEVFDRP